MADERVSEEKKERPIKPVKKDRAQSHADGSGEEGRLSRLQKTVGNRAVQRLLVQLKGEGSYEVDDETTERINRERVQRAIAGWSGFGTNGNCIRR